MGKKKKKIALFFFTEYWKCRKFAFLMHTKFSRTGKNLIFSFPATYAISVFSFICTRGSLVFRAYALYLRFIKSREERLL